jgi:16S rRNA (guanine1207-N2)-methyltransferase
MNHYFSHRPEVAQDQKHFTFELRGRTYRFTTDAGVFSKQRIDFGSVLLIECMEISEGDAVLDMGCGYGPIGVVAAQLAGQGKVWMVDVNERAVALARKNLEDNGVGNAEVIVSDLYDQIPETMSFDVIVTNPPIRTGKEKVFELYEESYKRLKRQGCLWTVIQKKQGAPSTMKKLQALFAQVEKVKQEKGYWIIRAVK